MATKTKKTEADETQETAPSEQKETTKNAKAYNITCGTFKSRGEALLSAARAKKAGVNASIVIENVYIVVAEKGASKERAEAIKEQLEAAKLQADISEQ